VFLCLFLCNGTFLSLFSSKLNPIYYDFLPSDLSVSIERNYSSKLSLNKFFNTFIFFSLLLLNFCIFVDIDF